VPTTMCSAGGRSPPCRLFAVRVFGQSRPQLSVRLSAVTKRVERRMARITRTPGSANSRKSSSPLCGPGEPSDRRRAARWTVAATQFSRARPPSRIALECCDSSRTRKQIAVPFRTSSRIESPA
jgi:hypothetical protein